MSRGLWISLIAVVVVGGGVGFFLARRGSSPEALLAAEMDAAKKDGMALSAADLERSVPDDQNAAPGYESAFQAIRPTVHDHPNLLTEINEALKGTADAEAMKDIRAAVSESRRDINSLIAASRRKSCDFDYDFEGEFKFPELADARVAARLMIMSAHVAADQGYVDEAYDVLSATEAMSRHIGETPLLICYLVQISLDRYVAEEFVHVLNLSVHKPALLKKAQKTLDGFGPIAAITPALRAEAFVGLSNMNRCQTTGDVRAVTDPNQKGQGAKLTDEQKVRLKLAAVSGLRRGLEATVAAGTDPRAQHDALARLVAKQDDEAAKDHSPDHDLIAMIARDDLLPDAALAAGLQMADRHILATAIKLMQAKGPYPSTLPNLGEISIDPMDGKPLRYRRTGSGFTLYSIGHNLKDDGGSPDDRAKTFK
ncbi:MAG TPA: hypothetical protein VHE55_07880 [Fimbriimonadaceae bacterium]|nr:hypothetical protein [Fimbriimonadaceae bacterium]